MDADRWLVVVALMAVIVSTAVALVLIGIPGEQTAGSQALVGISSLAG